MSHYDWPARNGIPDDHVTSYVVESGFKVASRTANNCAATCIGRWPHAKARKQFWDEVAFYNYIQQYVGTKSGVLHRYSLWRHMSSPLRTYSPLSNQN
jgi:hypothetical protein